EMGDALADRLLQRMVVFEVAPLGRPALHAPCEHPAVLAGAVVRERRPGGRWRDLAANVVEARGMAAALQLADDAARFGEHVGHGGNVTRLAGVAGAEQRDLRGAEAEARDA